jgi:hypothetical protein
MTAIAIRHALNDVFVFETGATTYRPTLVQNARVAYDLDCEVAMNYKLSNERLSSLAQNHRPPQSWYEEEEIDLFS